MCKKNSFERVQTKFLQGIREQLKSRFARRLSVRDYRKEGLACFCLVEERPRPSPFHRKRAPKFILVLGLPHKADGPAWQQDLYVKDFRAEGVIDEHIAAYEEACAAGGISVKIKKHGIYEKKKT